MEIMFVEAKKKPTEQSKEQIKKAVQEFKKNFPKIKKVGLLASVQYLDFLPILKKELGNKGIKTFESRGNLTRYKAQILGCDISAAKNIEKNVHAFILLSNGRFHAIQIAKETRKPVFILQEDSIQQIKKEEIENMKGKRLAAIKKFLAGHEIGIIISTKHGQQNMKEALKIKSKLEKKGKKAFLFIADTININEFENFSCQSWLNTACPALILDSNKIVNWHEVEKFYR